MQGTCRTDCGTRTPERSSQSAAEASDVPTSRLTLLRSSAGKSVVPHKRLWRLTDAEGADLACELDALTSNRVLLTVTRNGEAIIRETFADKRDALARSVGIYKEMKAGNP
jgi:hypothetical protein